MDRLGPISPTAKLAEAYVSYRLNETQLACLAQELDPKSEEEPTPGWIDRFEKAVRTEDAECPKTCPADAAKEITYDLQQQFESLDQTSTWSNFERAVYRKFSQPDFYPEPLPKSSDPVSANGELSALLLENFDHLDRNNNLRVEATEIDYLMTGGFYGELTELPTTLEPAAALATMKRYFDLLGSCNPTDGTGVSLHDLEIFADQGIPGQPLATDRINVVYDTFLEEAKAIQQGGSFLEERIDPAFIHQGTGGSCVLLATAAGLTPEQLQSMFSDNENGTYTVTFADGQSEIVTEPTLAERLYHSQGLNHERWPALLELAFMQRNYQNLRESGTRNREAGLRSAVDGVDPSEAMKALFGRDVQQHSLDEISPMEMRQLLQKAISSGGPVLCGSRMAAKGDFVSVDELHNGIANSHAYAVKAYDPDTDMVTLQNPWHRGEWLFQDSEDDGVFEMPALDFYSSFRWLGFPESDVQPAQVA